MVSVDNVLVSEMSTLQHVASVWDNQAAEHMQELGMRELWVRNFNVGRSKA